MISGISCQPLFIRDTPFVAAALDTMIVHNAALGKHPQEKQQEEQDKQDERHQHSLFVCDCLSLTLVELCPNVHDQQDPILPF